MLESTFYDAFGYHQSIYGLGTDNLQIKLVRIDNKPTIASVVSVIIGYCPIIGTIKGIFMFAVYDAMDRRINNDGKIINGTGDVNAALSQMQNYFYGMQLRNIVEITSLGFLLLIPDLIMAYNCNFYL